MGRKLPNQEQQRLMREQLNPKQSVLVCFADEALTSWAVDMVLACGANPVVYQADRRWKALIRMAIFNRASAVVGDPMLVLGLSKLARAYGMPLKIRRAVLVGESCADWLCEGVRHGLDCGLSVLEMGTDVRDRDLTVLEEHLLSWSSVLDCRLTQGPCGLEMEIITFPGEKMPKIPSCAKLVLRPWEPDRDKPLVLAENH